MPPSSGVNAEDAAHLRRRARRYGTEDVDRVGAAAYRVAVQEHHDLRQPKRRGVRVWRARARQKELPAESDAGVLAVGPCAVTHTGAQSVHALRTNCTGSTSVQLTVRGGGAALLVAAFRRERSKWGPHGLFPAYREGGSWAVGCAPNAGLPRAP